MSQRRILIMDDDEETRDILTAGLTQHGFDVIATGSAEEAVEICRTQSPDLAILDVYMPGASGIDAAIAIKKETVTPFLFLSASDEKDIVQQAVSVGALGYMVKPIDIFQLIPAVEAALVRATDIKALRDAQDNLSRALADGRGTSVAVGLIMERFRVGEDEAFNLLRHQAREQRRKISELAQDIIAAAERINLTPLRKAE